MTTTTQTEYTFDDLLAKSGDKLYELIEGQLVEKQVGAIALWAATQIARLIGNHVEPTGRGFVFTELPINCFGWLRNHGRRPDVVYMHRERFRGGRLSDDPVTAAPNLVAEVLSPNDDAIKVDVKVEEYLRAGVELVWVVNPETRTVRVHRADGSVHVFHEADTITGESVLPEFKAVVGEFFPALHVQSPQP
ncbi:MAG TPA: Uma2 family endonuclease [Tepidisphaeraceae bacterium]|nr:Uma2 family endonuclease [Tepidisphaeraceae bacterium]